MENIDIDKKILENIYIDIDIDNEIFENIDIDKEIFENIDIDKISNRLEFGISNRVSYLSIKVRIVKEVKRSDVSPVAMFSFVDVPSPDNLHNEMLLICGMFMCMLCLQNS